MFSSRAPKLIGAALMDLAEAMLRPVDADGFERAQDTAPAAARVVGDDWLTEQLFAGEFAPRPGLAPAPARTQRAARRTEPLLQRTDRARRPGWSSAPSSPAPRRSPPRPRVSTPASRPARAAHRGLRREPLPARGRRPPRQLSRSPPARPPGPPRQLSHRPPSTGAPPPAERCRAHRDGRPLVDRCTPPADREECVCGRAPREIEGSAARAAT